MMAHKSFVKYILVPCLFLAACGTEDTKKQLELKENKLNQKKAQLDSLDRQLKIKEQDLYAREQRLDSLKNHNDTLGIYNPKLVGRWLVTMQCTETTCEGYAVGDTKTEQWNIAYQNNKVIVKAISNKKVIRTYTGIFRDNSLELIAVPPPDANTQMNAVLTPHHTTEGLMEGQRIIERENNCKVQFSLKLEKQ